jgi:hypothetical protein
MIETPGLASGVKEAPAVQGGMQSQHLWQQGHAIGALLFMWMVHIMVLHLGAQAHTRRPG